MREILQVPADELSVNALKVTLSAAGRMLDLQARVDEGRLKRRKLDLLPKLLERMEKEEAAMRLRDAAFEMVVNG